MNPTSNEIKKQGAFRKILPYLVMISSPFVILMFIMAVVSGSDQVRRIPTPPHYSAPYLSASPTGAHQVAPTGSGAPPATIAEDLKTTSPYYAKVREQFTLPDISDWPPEMQEQARRYQSELCDLFVRCLELPEATRHDTWEEAFRRSDELTSGIVNRRIKYSRILSRERIDELKFNEFRRLDDISNRMLLGIYVVHKHWSGAATMFIESEADWDKELYYWRKDGARGRVVIVLRSFQRALGLGPNWKKSKR